MNKEVDSYNQYPAHLPPEDGYYLVSVKPPLILKIGLSPYPNILIARYSHVDREWTTTLGLSSMGLGNIASDVLAWCKLPLP